MYVCDLGPDMNFMDGEKKKFHWHGKVSWHILIINNILKKTHYLAQLNL